MPTTADTVPSRQAGPVTLQIDPKAEVVGLPILQLRSFLRRRGWFGFRIEDIERILLVGEEHAEHLLQALLAEGYLERGDYIASTGEQWYQVTAKGLRLSRARAGPRIRRKTADRLLRELVARMEELERRPELLFRVARAVVYGSYLRPEVERLGDLDIGLLLAPKEPDRARHRAKVNARIDEAREEGRHFPNIVDMGAFPEDEVRMFLRGRSKYISFLDLESHAQVPERDGYRVIYPSQSKT